MMSRPIGKPTRIWELDALRGLCILCVIVVHGLFDLVYFLRLLISFPPLYQFIQDNGGVIFIVLSGLCATLGSRTFRRGLIVFGCGMLITLVTWAMAAMNLAGAEVIVKFGILHLLGLCMMIFPCVRKWRPTALFAVGVGIVLIGYYLLGVTVESKWLFPLALRYPGFMSGDYFPLLPHLGWFFIGAGLGRTAYRKKITKFPRVNPENPFIRIFCFCGRQSLIIYLLHQPLLYGIMMLIA